MTLSTKTAAQGSHLFQNAAGFDIVGGQFVLGDVHNHPGTGPVRSGTSRPPLSTLDEAFSENEIYCSLLLRQKRGFPLYVPGPQINLPAPYQRHGVGIGDVGSITPEGIFDFFFNVFLPPQHPINANHTPVDFSPMPSYEAIDVFHLNYDPGNYVATSTVQKRDWDPPDEFPGGDFVFSCDGPQGAILALPYGAHLEKLRNVESLRTYAATHADSWYEYINGARGRGLANGDLYLVTGCEKARSWGMASYHTIGEEEFILSFKPTSRADTTYRPYRWGGADGQRNPSKRKGYDPPSLDDPVNQTTFVHGLSISLGTGLWARLFGTVTVETSSLADFHFRVNRTGDSQSTGSGGSLLSWSWNLLGGGTTGGNRHAGEPGAVVLSDLSPIAKVFNPAKLINEYILHTQAPQATVVITHDNDWCDILGDDSELSPSDFFQRIHDRFTVAEKDGATFLASKSAHVAHSASSPTDNVSALTTSPRPSSTPSDDRVEYSIPLETPEEEDEDETQSVDMKMLTLAAANHLSHHGTLEKASASAEWGMLVHRDSRWNADDDDYLDSVTFHQPMLPSEVEFDSEDFSEEDYFSDDSYAHSDGSGESQISSDSSIARSFRTPVPDVSRDGRQKGEHDNFMSRSLDDLISLPSIGGGRGSASVDGFGFDPNWSAMQSGITALDMGDVAVDARASHDRQPSQLSLILRRPSSVGAGSMMYDPDTFSAAVRGWGGEQYERQRKYWTFRRDEADRRDRGGVAGHGASDGPKHGLWKGMAIDAEEFWNSPLVGSFKVRRIGLRPQKPQQRVTIDPFHGPLTPKPPHHGPYTNIHKHSRVMAFSIHRHYKPARADPDVLGSRQRATGGVERPTAMLLLAPRHVQEVHMSKTATKRLASHGLLDEAEPGEGPKRLGKEKEKESVATSSRDYGAPSSDTRDQGFRQSSPRARSTFASHKSRSVEGEGDSDSDTGTERSERASSHTTHSEAFSTMDASSIEQMQMVFAQESEGSNGMLSRVLRRGPPVPRPSRAATPQVYIPPWMKLKQEEHTRRLDVLNSSFHDVGLLPPKKSMGRIGAKKAPVEGVDIFAQVPPDALFMLLPLWPGPTDPFSERNATKPPHEIPTEQRQYLLVSYKPMDENQLSKKHDGSDSGGRSERGRFHRSPKNSTGRACDILLTPYHISARLISHADLQGSGVRVPDEGLAVLGPWHEAWLTMPQIATRDHGLLVIGTCASREAGVEFDPNGLVKMGLCIPVPPDAGADELQEEPVAELTPIGKAVLEMAWIGCMAVTSFGPAGPS